MNKKYIGIGIIALLLVWWMWPTSGLLGGGMSTFVSPNACYSSSATSSLTYMTVGTATTTVTCNLGPDGANSAVLSIQAVASSTATTYRVYIEQSWDNQDWYPLAENNLASSTNLFNAGTRPFAEFVFASSTIGGSGYGGANSISSTTNSRNHYTLTVPTQMRFIRAFIALASSTVSGFTDANDNGAAWAAIYPRTDI